MTTRARLRLPRPLAHQRPVLNSASPRKLWRAGRRVGKSVAGRIAAVRGHGPKDPKTGKRVLRGMLDGGNIAWLTKTYKQSKVIWRKLLKAFVPLEGVIVTIDREGRRIEMIVGRGAIAVWSGHTRDAIDNLRGDAYDGVILDEAAYIDAEYAINDVLEPTLLDTGGWIFVFSTPNAGWDKNEQRIAPSYFNRLCANVIAGIVKTWEQWHNKTEDNPRLNAAAIAEYRANKPADSPTVQQEIDALLVAGGLMAIPELDERVHLIAAFPIPPHWLHFGAFDWGYQHPWSFGHYVVNEDGDAFKVDTIMGRRNKPHEIAERVGRKVPLVDLQSIVSGHDCWNERKAEGYDTPTWAERLAEYGMHLTKANIDHVQGLGALRDRVAWKGKETRDDGTREDGTPSLRFFDTPGNRRTFLCLQTRITDPLNPEDVLKEDAVDGEGGDDTYDETRYFAASRPGAAPSVMRHSIPSAWSPPALHHEVETKTRVRRDGPREQRPSHLGAVD